MDLAQAGDLVGGGGEQHPVGVPDGGGAQTGRMVVLPGARRPEEEEEDDVAVLEDLTLTPNLPVRS